MPWLELRQPKSGFITLSHHVQCSLLSRGLGISKYIKPATSLDQRSHNNQWVGLFCVVHRVSNMAYTLVLVWLDPRVCIQHFICHYCNCTQKEVPPWALLILL